MATAAVLTETPAGNLILASLEPGVSMALTRYLEPFDVEQGFVFYDEGDVVRHAWFPEAGLISLVTSLSDGFTVETAVIGREGAICAAPDLRPRPEFGRCMAQTEVRGLKVEIARLCEVAGAHPGLRHRLSLYEDMIAAEHRQSAACLARHEVTPRLARWLLRSQDRVGEDEIALTQEFLAHMLGAQRSTVSQAAGELEKAGLIRNARGRVSVLDRAGLEGAACECYAAMRDRSIELGLEPAHLPI